MKTFRKVMMAFVASAGLAAFATGGAQAGGKSYIVKSHSYHHGPIEIAHKIERVQKHVGDVGEILDPYKRDHEIDRLQSRLKKLRSETLKYRGNQVQRNLFHIDRIKARLAYIENKNNLRIRDVRAGKILPYQRNYRPGFRPRTQVRTFDSRGRLVVVDRYAWRPRIARR